MLRARLLHKRFGGHIALRALDLTVEPGEIYALLGPNGAGKTTTIQCFLGFLAPDGGHVTVDGLDPQVDPRGARARLAYIPEQVNLYGHFTGDENLDYFAELGGHRYSRKERTALLEEAGLQAVAFDQRVSGYSKGMRQKVGIAIALAKQARALLLDEPTSGLDPSASHEFSQLLGRISQDGVAVLMATHDLFRAREIATRVGIMRAGQLRREFAPNELSAANLEQIYLEEMVK
ncbi:ABC transporter ATP-binding protein [Luteimonas saliphila]|uniref:ABC transporter ATP-binding protein n=1 Tax=Luteimonas saliphila TaxID=2804919 RepID=UPI00192DE6D3|nr:ABC transporter ATP-binding protein [Luteimonas saliphila]